MKIKLSCEAISVVGLAAYGLYAHNVGFLLTCVPLGLICYALKKIRCQIKNIEVWY